MAGAMGISLCTKTGVSTPVRTATAELRHLSLHNEVQAHLVQDPLLNQRVQIRKKFGSHLPENPTVWTMVKALRHDREAESLEPARPAQQGYRPPCLRANRNLNGPRQSEPWGSLCATTGKLKAWNQHDLHNRGIDHHVERQTGSLYGRKDHGDKPRRRDRKTTT